MYYFFFFNDTATTEIYTLSLHDALPISAISKMPLCLSAITASSTSPSVAIPEDNIIGFLRSEEHTSELQSRQYLVCRLLLEKKKNLLCIPSFSLSFTSSFLPSILLSSVL